MSVSFFANRNFIRKRKSFDTRIPHTVLLLAIFLLVMVYHKI